MYLLFLERVEFSFFHLFIGRRTKGCFRSNVNGKTYYHYRLPGCRETVKDGINGFLVEPRNPRVLAEKICWMIENPDAVVKMSSESRKIVEEKFDINKVNQIIISTIFN